MLVYYSNISILANHIITSICNVNEERIMLPWQAYRDNITQVKK